MKTSTKRILTILVATMLVFALAMTFVACDVASDTDTTAQTLPDGNTPPTPPDNNGQGGQQGGFPGQQGGMPGGQGGSNVAASNITTTGADKSEVLAQIEAFDFEVDFDDVTDHSTLDVTTVNLDELTSDYEISASGNYVFTGTTTFRIVLAKKNIDVHIWLENATLDSIYSDKKPNSTVITLVGENTLTGVMATADEDAKGTLYVKNDLLINGNGSLSVTSGEDTNGVHCTGRLVIEDATLTVNSGKHGLRGNDAVVLKGATLNITCLKDGVQNDNEVDYEDLAESYDVTFRYIYIESSDITIVSGDDGINAATLLYVKSGDINVTTNGGAPANITETSSDNADGKGLKAGSLEYAVSDDLLATELAKGDRVDTGEDDSDGVSIVELSSVDYYTIVIEGGTVTVNANDDAIHSDGNLFINGGTLNLTSGDDGVHAEDVLKITAGTITVNNCYEGIEAAKLEIAGGNINVTAQDDGLNAADGTNAQMGYVNQNCYLIISGGVVRVNAGGDGIDSNNAVYISGGEVYIDGPTNGGNSALDSEAGIVVDGGKLVAVSAVGMVETPSMGSAQKVVVYTATSNIAAGTTITVKDASGNTVLEHTTAKASQSVIVSANFETGATYTLYVNGTSVGEATLNDAVTYLGSNAGGMQGGQPGGQGGQPGGQQPGGRR
ncbi:MAG: carbohydrate-binding domain-containing protein [Clostridia bacterium]|nr:carbohydrate-binding domain-containing protein [Clostridia bacterium]